MHELLATDNAKTFGPFVVPAWQGRIMAGVIFCASLSLLLLAAWLEPAVEGHGTHTAMGLPPCGFLLATGLPCMTCGMTTSFAHAGNGNLLASFQTQPMGAILALATAMAALICGYALVTGMRVAWIANLMFKPRIITAIAIGFGLAWAYKIAVMIA